MRSRRGVGEDLAPAWILPAALGLALVPIVTAVVRAIADGWRPIGDNAYFAIRAQDVLSTKPPLLGTWSSASEAAGTDFNNPGPLLFDILALPTSLWDRGAGTALGVALFNALAVAGIAVFARRRGGTALGVVAMVIVATLAWTMGSELLFDPWQPHSLLLCFLLFLVLVWSLAAGDASALPWTALVSSVILQTHLSYTILVPAMVVWGLVGLGRSLRRARRAGGEAWPSAARGAKRAAVVSAVIVVVCWVPPVVEQFTADGRGNLSRLASSFDNTGSEIVGLTDGIRYFASVTALPPWWLRPSFSETLFTTGGYRAPALGLAVAALAVLVAALAGCRFLARRRRDEVATTAVDTVAVALLLGFVTMLRAPISRFGVAPHQFRWLWPLAAFAALAVAVAVMRCLPVVASARRRVGPGPWRLAGLAVLAVVVAANLPSHNPRVGPSVDAASIPAVTELQSQMGAVEDEGRLLVRAPRARVGDPYATAVLAELRRREVAFVVDDPPNVRQLGPERRFTGTNADALLTVRYGAEALRRWPDARRVAFVPALSAAERRERDRLIDELAPYFDGLGALPFNAKGRAALETEVLRDLRETLDEPLDTRTLLESGDLADLVLAELLRVDRAWSGRVERYARLQERLDRDTVGLFLGPAP